MGGEIIRIGQALWVASLSIGLSFGIPFGLFWLVIKFGSDRNESRICSLGEAYGDVPAVPRLDAPVAHERLINTEGQRNHGA